MDSQNLLTKAKEYLDKGLSVIPIGENKKPLIPWKKYQTEYPTKKELEQWWKDFPNANIGIVTGKLSNIAVIDIEKGGSTKDLTPTLIAKTGGGGWHYYYKYKEGVENKTRFRELADIRGEGGYVVAPPSKHASGEKYEWSWVQELEPFPTHLIPKTEKTDWKQYMQGVSNGNRNSTAAKLCGKLMNAFRPEEWELAVYPMLRNWNLQNNPPLEEKELRTIFESISNRAVNDVRTETVEDKVEDIKFHTFTNVLQRGKSELLNTTDGSYINFGLDFLDDALTGIFDSELIVIGGETGTGKTTFATNVVYKASKDVKCCVFALEDRLEDYGIKALFFKTNQLRQRDGLASFNWNDFRRNQVSKDDNFEFYLDQAIFELKNDNIEFVETKELMDIDIFEKLLEQKCLEGTELFLVDHLHYFDLLRGDSTKADYIEKVMVRVRNLQKRTGARILMIVHYKKLDGKKPTLDSFKDSVSIVQNANYVINLWRDREQRDDFNNETLFLLPKTRNPNGEATITAIFDKTINDYKHKETNYGTPQKDTTTFNNININDKL